MKQNDAVFQAVCTVLETDEFNGVVELSKEERDTVISMVTEGILSGKVDFSAEARSKYDTPQRVKMYTTGMVSNHLRKDKRLNGGSKYEIKNPGSRAGSTDDQLKALKALRSTISDSEQLSQIDEAIATRQAEIAASKQKAVAINVEAIPEHLRHLVTSK